MTKPHISATQMEMFAKCPRQYYFRYVAGQRNPPGIALLTGKAFHTGAEINMRQKIESHVDLPESDIVDSAVAAFDSARYTDGLVLTKEESSRGEASVIGNAQDAVASLARTHAKEQAPDYQPTLVEHTVRIELPGPRDLLGVIDLADDQRRVVDFKTAGKKKSQADVDTSMQLTIYSAAYALETGEQPSEVRLDVLASQKKGVSRQVLSGTRTDADVAALANRIESVSRLLEIVGDDPDLYPPASPGSWWCGPKWCGYWRQCPCVNSERTALAEGGE